MSRCIAVLTLGFVLGHAAASAAQSPSSEQQIERLRVAIDALRDQLSASQQQVDALRRDLQTLRADLARMVESPQVAGDRAASDRAEEAQQVLEAKIDAQEQTKVESGSKYHVRLSGLALIQAVSARGTVDDLDVPGTADPRGAGDSRGSFGMGLRQSMVRMDVFGPTIANAKAAGELTFDFFGGFPAQANGTAMPLPRLKTASIALEWERASLIAGQETLFFSPRSPTSLASTAYPALWSSGNLWAWTPQVHADYRWTLTRGSTLLIQAGLLNPFANEAPGVEYRRVPNSGERSALPAEAVRLAWRRARDERAAEIGVGAYHANQNWMFDRSVDSWAATADWDVPIGPWIALSGETYRGRAIAGLGGSASPAVLFDGSQTLATGGVMPMTTTGGWVQLKVKPGERLEWNGAYGIDDPSRSGLADALVRNAALGPTPMRNASAFVNTIFTPRSNLVFSIEVRRLWTERLDGTTRTADHVSITTGIGF